MLSASSLVRTFLLPRRVICRVPTPAGGGRRYRRLCRGLPVAIFREHIVLGLCDGVAPNAALGIVVLRRRVCRCGRSERICSSVIQEVRISPSAAVSKSLAVLH